MVAAADKNGTILRRTRASTPRRLDAGLDRLHQMIEEVADGEAIGGIGAAIGGPLDWEKGIVSPLHQPEWRNVPLKRIMEERWNAPFFVDVDTNVAALGEYRALEKPPRLLLYLTLSTGMGGGFVIDGKLYRGQGGAHPEVGHQGIPYRCRHPERIHCDCGAPDCLEALISGNGIRRIYGKAAEDLDAGEWDEVAFNLGQGLRNLAAIYLPDLIVVGGGVAIGGGDRLLETARQVMAERLRLTPHPLLKLSTLGYDTALLGAISIARRGLGSAE
ncbi:MAG: ROK family protein [Candidatus Omnitrophica bacterium]|nr:ROK family protein [Candidatus Omnitrophota bacterium]